MPGPEMSCVYQFKVVLRGIRPMMWRRLLLRPAPRVNGRSPKRNFPGEAALHTSAASESTRPDGIDPVPHQFHRSEVAG